MNKNECMYKKLKKILLHIHLILSFVVYFAAVYCFIVPVQDSGGSEL